MKVKFNTKKAIGPVVATALLIVVTVVALVGFQGWFSGYQTTLNTQVESQSNNQVMSTGIETMIGSTIFIKNGYEDLIIDNIKIDGIECDFNESLKNLEGGMQHLNLDNCFDNLSTNSPEVVVVTNKGIMSKYVFLKDVNVTYIQPPNIDNTPPTINILCTIENNCEDNITRIEVGIEYIDEGATAVDNIDGDITDNLQVENNVNTNVPSIYNVTYRVNDSAGNQATAIRTVYVYETNIIVAFTEVGEYTWVVPDGVKKVDVLVVAGGGGGGYSGNDVGGGGAGGLIFRPNYELFSNLIIVEVGSGGFARQNGENSIFHNLIALGGGYGGDRDHSTDAGSDGGSGGGGGNHGSNSFGGIGLQPEQNGDSGAPYGYGNNGGSAINNYGAEAGGGGGAGKSGGNAMTISPGQAGFGGDGLYEVIIFEKIYNFVEIFGYNYGEIIDNQVWFAGGGGGGGERGVLPLGGKGGGGNGGHPDGISRNGSPGLPNTGGGGGGSDNTMGGNGGSGIVLIKYCLYCN